MLNNPSRFHPQSIGHTVIPPTPVLVGEAVTINPAFLREIKQDNLRFREIVEHVTRFVETGSYLTRDLSLIVNHVKELCEQVARHFNLEEAYGYFVCPITVVPELARRAECLRAEHSEIHSELTSIFDELLQRHPAVSDNGRQSGIVRRLRDVLNRLQLHEARENELIQRASNEDLGVAD